MIKLCDCTNGEISGTINVDHDSSFTHLSFGKNKILAAATEHFLIYIFDNYEIIDKLTYKVFNLHLSTITSLNFINHSCIISSDIRGYWYVESSSLVKVYLLNISLLVSNGILRIIRFHKNAFRSQSIPL